ncbi:class I SAM-dependent methyltransferase [Mycobacterium sp.]|jgi:methyltransferase (TIGR00027 family)|uniref:class I SAM-dependent methyltransferase n=1 Tax=Mycobacterium sp. TaxID=1785 RepID=UPI002D3827A2|nr:class I SAM-dependent methyltransferase [Mycobacterium sp.]HZA10278.1 class I SAM-dependent methyltransferase [Mycobacterium sp.]
MTSRTGKLDFTAVGWRSVEWTALCTLYLRACESRLCDPMLGDHFAAEAVERIDYDWHRMHRAALPWTTQFRVALRARQFDAWTTDFVSRHPDAVVLHLGCGLDSRALRVAPPPEVQWFDVDVPELIALRRRLCDGTDGYRMIGARVIDPGWLDEVPAEHPTLMVAEGLLPYLTEAEIRQLLERITDRFGSGEVIFDVLSQWGPRTSKLIKSGVRDRREIERWNPRLRCLESTSAMSGYERIPLTPQRLVFGSLYRLPMVRDSHRLYRFSFNRANG